MCLVNTVSHLKKKKMHPLRIQKNHFILFLFIILPLVHVCLHKNGRYKTASHLPSGATLYFPIIRNHKAMMNKIMGPIVNLLQSHTLSLSSSLIFSFLYMYSQVVLLFFIGSIASRIF